MKGLLPRWKDQGAAFFVEKNTLQRGISLIEAIVALALLAFVLLTSVLVRFTLSREDSVRVDELSAAAILRQKCMAFQSNLTNELTNTTTNDFLETGEGYNLSVAIVDGSTYLRRLNLVLSASDSEGRKKISMFRSRVQLLAAPRSAPDEGTIPLMDASPSTFNLHVFVTNAGGNVMVFGSSSTNYSNTNVSYGVKTTLEAKNTGGNFSGWYVNTNLVSGDATNNTMLTIYMDDDKEIEAKFQ